MNDQFTTFEENPHTRCHCAGCTWAGPFDQLVPIANLTARISPGEIVPAGECPECGALAHIVRAAAVNNHDALISACDNARKLLLRLRDREVISDAPEIRELSATLNSVKGL